MRIAVDAMGGDHAPTVVVEGALAAVDARDDLKLSLFGPAGVVSGELDRLGSDNRITVVDAPDVVGMAEPPTSALKNKKQSSIHLGLAAHAAGETDAFVSAGNTGAVMAVSLFALGRLNNISRPSVIGLYPTLGGTTVLIDVGTNVDCKPEHLAQFARMGSVYAERVLGIDNPSVGLLNVGEEPGKGNEQAKATHKLLEIATELRFIGNIEGRELLNHAADVVVCDGFVGNVLLKFGESISTVLPTLAKREMARMELTPEQQKLVGGVLRGVKDRFSYERFGGAPLLGVRGTVVIGHGGSSAEAVKNMILAATTMVERDVAAALDAAFA